MVLGWNSMQRTDTFKCWLFVHSSIVSQWIQTVQVLGIGRGARGKQEIQLEEQKYIDGFSDALLLRVAVQLNPSSCSSPFSPKILLPSPCSHLVLTFSLPLSGVSRSACVPHPPSPPPSVFSQPSLPSQPCAASTRRATDDSLSLNGDAACCLLSLPPPLPCLPLCH